MSEIPKNNKTKNKDLNSKSLIHTISVEGKDIGFSSPQSFPSNPLDKIKPMDQNLNTFNTSSIYKNKIISIKVNTNRTIAPDSISFQESRKNSFNHTNYKNFNTSMALKNKSSKINELSKCRLIIPSININKSSNNNHNTNNKLHTINTSKNKNSNILYNIHSLYSPNHKEKEVKLNSIEHNNSLNLSSNNCSSKLQQYRVNSTSINQNINIYSNAINTAPTQLSSINESSNNPSINLNINSSNNSYSTSKDQKSCLSGNTNQRKTFFNNSTSQQTNQNTLNQYYSTKKLKQTTNKLKQPNNTINTNYVISSNSLYHKNSKNSNSDSYDKKQGNSNNNNNTNNNHNNNDLFQSIRLLDSRDKQERLERQENENYYFKELKEKERFDQQDNIPSLKQKLLSNNFTNKKAPMKLFLNQKLVESIVDVPSIKYSKNFQNMNKNISNNNDSKEKAFLLTSNKKSKITKINIESNNKSCFSLRSDEKKDKNSYSTMSWEYSEKDKSGNNQFNSYLAHGKSNNMIKQQHSNSMSYAKIVDKLSVSSSSNNIKRDSLFKDNEELQENSKKAFNLKSQIGFFRRKNINKTLNITISEIVNHNNNNSKKNSD